MYLWFSFAMFIVGGLNALLLRSELFQPGLQIVTPEFFNQLTTMHGLIMVFGAIMPAFVGFVDKSFGSLLGRCTPLKEGETGAAGNPCSATGAAGFDDKGTYYGGRTEDVSFFAAGYRASGGGSGGSIWLHAARVWL